jgi:hypothetical protein
MVRASDCFRKLRRSRGREPGANNAISSSFSDREERSSRELMVND